jgi:hypothetical protein
MTNDRPDPPSEGAPDFKNTQTVKQYLTSGHEPQMGLDNKTDSFSVKIEAAYYSETLAPQPHPLSVIIGEHDQQEGI